MSEKVEPAVEPAKSGQSRAEKYPELNAQFEALRKEKEKIDAVVNPLRAARDAVVAKMAPLEAEARELAAKISAHLPRLGEIERQLGALARAMGGKSLSSSG